MNKSRKSNCVYLQTFVAVFVASAQSVDNRWMIPQKRDAVDVVPYEIAVVANGHIPRASITAGASPRATDKNPPPKKKADMFFVEVIAPE